MNAGARTKLSSPERIRLPLNRQRIFARMVGQDCPHRRSRIQCRFAFGREPQCSRASAFSKEKLKLGGMQLVPGLAAEETKGMSIATKRITTSPMCACRVFASISGSRNSRLSGQASGCTGYDRRHPSLVGARRLCPKVGAENCRDCHETRRTRFSRRKAVSRWPDILPRLFAIPVHTTATVDTTLYSCRN